MKKKIIITVGIILTILLTSAVTYAVNSGLVSKKTKPSDYKIGITYEDALKADKPVIALFYADWCGYCLRFMPRLKTIEDLYKSKYNFVMLDVEDTKNIDLIEDVALTGYPTVYVIDPKYNNRFLLNNAIYMDLPKFREELDRYLKVRKLLDSANTCAKGN